MYSTTDEQFYNHLRTLGTLSPLLLCGAVCGRPARTGVFWNSILRHEGATVPSWRNGGFEGSCGKTHKQTDRQKDRQTINSLETEFWYRVAKMHRIPYKLQVSFRKRIISYKALLWKMTSKSKASYGSLPPCIGTYFESTHIHAYRCIYLYSCTK